MAQRFTGALRDAPTFRPTEAEWAEPYAFFARVWGAAEAVGIAKIVPPPSWSPPLPVAQDVRFRTRKQPIHLLRHRTRARQFLSSLREFYLSDNDGMMPTRRPVIDGVSISLWRLYSTVRLERGPKRCDFAKIAPAFGLDASRGRELRALFDEMLGEYYVRHDVRTVPLCNVCRSDADASLLMQCSSCGEYQHSFCSSPVQDAIPKDWVCAACVRSHKEVEAGMMDDDADVSGFGFVDGPRCTLADMADRNKAFVDSLLAQRLLHEDSVEETERLYWETVETHSAHLHVLYGNDQESRPPDARTRSGTDASASESSWGLAKLHMLPGSVLKVMEPVSGVTRPWFYVGMKLSTFCWHTEDNFFPSINYNHLGAEKLWYGVPGSHALQFEAAMRALNPTLFAETPDLLHRLVTATPPAQLAEHGIPICRLVQRQGEIVITLPRAYHSGFNCGFNIAEACNFSPVSWIPFGRVAMRAYVPQRHAPVVDHDRLMLRCALAALDDPARNGDLLCARLVIDVREMLEALDAQMHRVKSVLPAAQFVRQAADGKDAVEVVRALLASLERSCHYCHTDCTLVTCVSPARPGRFACTEHIKHVFGEAPVVFNVPVRRRLLKDLLLQLAGAREARRAEASAGRRLPDAERAGAADKRLKAES